MIRKRRKPAKIKFSELSVEELREWVKAKAHELYLAGGRQPDDDWQDWFRAEELLVENLLENNDFIQNSD